MTIPFIKAHGARNDFLLTWSDAVAGLAQSQLSAAAVAICDRNAGVGADGWELVSAGGPEGAHGTIRLFNSDGSEVEISGNGTRCAAALLVDSGAAPGVPGEEVVVMTGAGRKTLRLLERSEGTCVFEMNMGVPVVEEGNLRYALPLESGMVDVTILDVGNPQCSVLVTEMPENWKQLGAEIEGHHYFPRRTNVSFVQVIDRHTIEARYYERGAGATMSSGTGSTGAAATAILRGVADSPVTVITEAGPLKLRWDDSIFLTGPAELTARGEFFWRNG